MDFSTLKDAFAVFCAVVTVASAVCAATPTPDPASMLGRVYRVIEMLGLVVGKAKDQGLIPDRKR